MNQQIAFLGLGLMGAPMARNLARAGHPLTVWNRSHEKAEPFAAESAEVAQTAAEAVQEADIVITMLQAGPAVEKVLFESGVAARLRKHALVVDMSSIKPGEAQAHAERLRSLGVHHIDAPVSGGVPGAEAATLAIMAGGESDQFHRATSVLSDLGHPVLVGDSGSGQLAKLANQIIVGATIGAVAEALMLAQRGGADGTKVIEALSGGFADSTILQNHGRRMLSRDFAVRGRCVTHLKDLNNALGAGGILNLPKLPYCTLTAELFQQLIDHAGDLDHAALLVALEARNELQPEEVAR